MKKSGIGQGMLEYIIVFAIVVAALIVVGNMFFPKVQDASGQLHNAMQSKVQP